MWISRYETPLLEFCTKKEMLTDFVAFDSSSALFAIDLCERFPECEGCASRLSGRRRNFQFHALPFPSSRRTGLDLVPLDRDFSPPNFISDTFDLEISFPLYLLDHLPPTEDLELTPFPSVSLCTFQPRGSFRLCTSQVLARMVSECVRALRDGDGSRARSWRTLPRDGTRGASDGHSHDSRLLCSCC